MSQQTPDETYSRPAAGRSAEPHARYHISNSRAWTEARRDELYYGLLRPRAAQKVLPAPFRCVTQHDRARPRITIISLFLAPHAKQGVDGDSPQITWGSIDGTPMILDPRATPLPDGSLPAPMDFASIVGALGGDGGPGVKRFEIKDLPTRDKLAHRLEAVDTRRKRAKLGLRTDGSGNKQAQTPGSATPLTPRTPGAGRSKTPGTAQRTPGSGRRTPGTGRSRDSRGVRGVAAGAGATPLTPAARTLAAKLGHRKDAGTPFGGGLTPGRQKRRSGSRRGSGSKGGGLTPLPVTPAGGVRVGSATPVEGRGASTEAEGGKQSSLTDGLLAMK